MTYFCFIDSRGASVPYMEPLTAKALDEAKAQAANLLREHSSGIVAHLFYGDEYAATVRPDGEEVRLRLCLWRLRRSRPFPHLDLKGRRRLRSTPPSRDGAAARSPGAV